MPQIRSDSEAKEKCTCDLVSPWWREKRTLVRRRPRAEKKNRKEEEVAARGRKSIPQAYKHQTKNTKKKTSHTNTRLKSYGTENDKRQNRNEEKQKK